MTNALEVFFSNRLEILYQQLKISLFGAPTKPLMRRLVVVNGPAMKNWLILRLAQDPELNVAMGIDFIYLSQAFEYLLQLSTRHKSVHFPSTLELSLAIEAELHRVIQNDQLLDREERSDWEAVMHHLKLSHASLPSKPSLSRKTENRVIGLSEHLARLFHNYGRFAFDMVAQWEKPEDKGWQPRLWRKLFCEKREWSYPSRALQQEIAPEEFTLHLFSISFMATSEFIFLNHLASHVPVHYYLLSPCAVFWSDIRSDRESAFLENHWRKKFDRESAQMLKLEELLRDRNPLLANFGRIGREMSCQIEESQAITHATYVLPEHIQELTKDLDVQDDLILTDAGTSLSLLHALQADLLLMRNPEDAPVFNFDHDDRSLQLHIAPGKRREIEILYHNLLRIILDDPSISLGEIVVMAPQIEDYAPFIQSIFGEAQSQLDFQILDLGLRRESRMVQGFLHLLQLSEGQWNASELLQLFGNSAFQHCHQLSTSDFKTIQEWIEETGIRWGDDWMHRNVLLQQRHCQRGMAEETMVGTWDYGLSRLMLGLVASQESLFEVPLSSSIEFSDGELLGKWIKLLHALRDDLSPLQDGSRMIMSDWVNYLNCLLESYLTPDPESQQSISEYEELKQLFEILMASSSTLPEVQWTFHSVKTRLLSLVESRDANRRDGRLQTICFCSFMPLRSMPAKVVALLGLQEDAFPRNCMCSSLNQMEEEGKGDFSPLSTDFDRHLFLETLHSAQDYLLISYCGFSQQDHKELNPSLVVEELFSYLNKYYTIQGSTIREKCFFKHPFDAFDPTYFTAGSSLNNFSLQDFQAAQAVCKTDRSPPHQFLKNFDCIIIHPKEILPARTLLNLRHLVSAAKDPIRFHFNKTLEMYLESPEDRQVKTEEEISIAHLDRFFLKQEAVLEPIEQVLLRAERDGKLPFGMFKEVARQQFKEEREEFHKCLKNHALTSADIFEIEFTAECTSPVQVSDVRWQFPPVVLSYEDGYQFSIIGKIPLATQKGLLTLSKDSLPELWKAWPQFLLYCSAVKSLPQQWKPQLIPVHSAKIKPAFFDDPEPYLKKFIHYYVLCHRNFSPLMPDWIPFFLQADAAGLHNKISQLFTETGKAYRNPYLQWIFNKDQLPDSQGMIRLWKEQASLLAGDLAHHWFQGKFQEVAE